MSKGKELKQEDKSENHILVPIYYYEDEDGKKVYDYDEMKLEFEMEFDKLNEEEK